MTAGMKRYRIVAGSFVHPDNTVVGVGEEIELTDEKAAEHALQIVLIDEARAASEVHSIGGNVAAD